MQDKTVYTYGGTSDCGYGREVNEDFFDFVVLSDTTLFALVADGAGSKQNGLGLQPAVVAASEITEAVRRLYACDPEMFLAHPAEMLLEAVNVANRVVGAFKVANEELYSGFGVCLSCCLVYENSKFCFAHCGNSRIHLLRLQSDGSSRIIQLTQDHTKAAQLMQEDVIKGEEYYSHPARYVFTSGIGIAATPEIQTYSGQLRKGDILLLTTDGVHYAIRPEAMGDIVLQAGNWSAATKGLTDGARMLKMEDNATAALVFVHKD
ncbi:MAG: serine/threonine-protein phosphatase [Oscillospiraceae bacterium]|nr:serine/threonine-protein phosphatase [Oscillospiraceae bacterium]